MIFWNRLHRGRASRSLAQILVGCVGAGALVLSAGSAFATGDMSSVNIVEPKLQSKWGYAPGTQRIQPGTWVTWSNAGQDPHTVTADDGSFDSGNLDPSEGFSWFFSDPGTFQYTCALHAWMTGKIIVGDGKLLNPPPPSDPVPTDDPSSPTAP
jgi:plastocyanin